MTYRDYILSTAESDRLNSSVNHDTEYLPSYTNNFGSSCKSVGKLMSTKQKKMASDKGKGAFDLSLPNIPEVAGYIRCGS